MAYLMIVLIVFLVIFIIYRALSNILELSGFESGAKSQKSVLISGCDSGFGHDLALKLIKKGVLTFAGCYTKQGQINLTNQAKKLNSEKQLIVFHLDVTNQDSVDEAVRLVQNSLTENQVLWALVNNAGIPGSGPDDWMSMETFQQNLDVNCFGVIRLTQAFLPMLKQSKGRIVAITSMYARWAQYGGGPYAVSKHAVLAYLECIRNELNIFGVTVHLLEPGFFRTATNDPDGLADRMRQYWTRIPQSMKDEYGDDYLEKSISSAKSHIEWITSFNGSSIDEVVNNYYHAITARWPRQRYYPGLEMKRIMSLLFFPTSFLDFIQMIGLKMRGYPVPKACQ